MFNTWYIQKFSKLRSINAQEEKKNYIACIFLTYSYLKSIQDMDISMEYTQQFDYHKMSDYDN